MCRMMTCFSTCPNSPARNSATSASQSPSSTSVSNKTFRGKNSNGALVITKNGPLPIAREQGSLLLLPENALAVQRLGCRAMWRSTFLKTRSHHRIDHPALAAYSSERRGWAPTGAALALGRRVYALGLRWGRPWASFA